MLTPGFSFPKPRFNCNWIIVSYSDLYGEFDEVIRAQKQNTITPGFSEFLISDKLVKLYVSKSQVCNQFFFLNFELDDEFYNDVKSWNQIKPEEEKTGHTQKFAINKKSTIFVLFSWNLVEIITS